MNNVKILMPYVCVVSVRDSKSCYKYRMGQRHVRGGIRVIRTEFISYNNNNNNNNNNNFLIDVLFKAFFFRLNVMGAATGFTVRSILWSVFLKIGNGIWWIFFCHSDIRAFSWIFVSFSKGILHLFQTSAEGPGTCSSIKMRTTNLAAVWGADSLSKCSEMNQIQFLTCQQLRG